MRTRHTKDVSSGRLKWIVLGALILSGFLYLGLTDVTAPVTLVQKDIPRERLAQTP